MVLPWLNLVEVGAFTFREAVLAVKLELSGYNRVLTPAVHVECSLGKNEDASIGKTVGDGTGDGSTDGSGASFSLLSTSSNFDFSSSVLVAMVAPLRPRTTDRWSSPSGLWLGSSNHRSP